MERVTVFWTGGKKAGPIEILVEGGESVCWIMGGKKGHETAEGYHRPVARSGGAGREREEKGGGDRQKREIWLKRLERQCYSRIGKRVTGRKENGASV